VDEPAHKITITVSMKVKTLIDWQPGGDGISVITDLVDEGHVFLGSVPPSY